MGAMFYVSQIQMINSETNIYGIYFNGNISCDSNFYISSSLLYFSYFTINGFSVIGLFVNGVEITNSYAGI